MPKKARKLRTTSHKKLSTKKSVAGTKATERSGHGEIKKWFLRTLNNAGGQISWKDLLVKFRKKYPGKQTAVLYSYFKSGIAARDKKRNVRLTRKGKRL